MASHNVSPGLFKSKDAEPEATLELFEDYCETMERVFRLTRRIHPTSGARIDFDDAEKKDLIQVEGVRTCRTCSSMLGWWWTDTYKEAVDKIKNALKKCNDHIIKLYSKINVHCFGTYYIDIFCKYSNNFIDNKSMFGE